MSKRVIFHALGAHELQADSFSAEIGNGLSIVLSTGNIVSEVSFHVLDAECFVHRSILTIVFLNNAEINIDIDNGNIVIIFSS